MMHRAAIPATVAFLVLFAPDATRGQEQPPDECALCLKEIPAGRGVTLILADGARNPFRCIHCALTVQATAAPGASILARSSISDREIVIRRDAQGWSVSPAEAVFLSLPEEGGECMDRHQVFADEIEYERYLVEHPELPAARAVPRSIDRLADILVSGLPEEGLVRPEAPVQLLVVGMVTHLPFKDRVLPEIQGALEDAGEAVGARFVDASRPEGKAILEAHGVREHLPVAMFLDGTTRFRLGDREVDLRGFPGRSWTRADLAAVLRRAASEGR